jgi:hypothetical protein
MNNREQNNTNKLRLKKKYLLIPVFILISFLIFQLISRYIGIGGEYVTVSGGDGDAVHYVPKRLYDLQDSALKSNDPKLCLRLGSNNGTLAPNTESCISQLAVINRDKGLCSIYLTKNDINLCLSNYEYFINQK